MSSVIAMAKTPSLNASTRDEPDVLSSSCCVMLTA
jgi:hypothetical protein